MVRVIPVDQYDENFGVLVPFITQRVVAYAKSHVPEMDSITLARMVMMRLANRDPLQRVLALVDPDTGKVAGHAVAEIQGDQQHNWAFVSQCFADPGGNLGNVTEQVVGDIERWAGSMGVQRILWASHSKNEALTRKLGFKIKRVVMERAIEPIVSPLGEKKG